MYHDSGDYEDDVYALEDEVAKFIGMTFVEAVNHIRVVGSKLTDIAKKLHQEA